jgi:hypothetical protein
MPPPSHYIFSSRVASKDILAQLCPREFTIEKTSSPIYNNKIALSPMLGCPGGSMMQMCSLLFTKNGTSSKR